MARGRITEGNDRVFGDKIGSNDNFNDNIDALGGNDSIFGLGGDDTLSGGAGNDSIRGGAGDDTIRGGNDSSNNFNRLFGDDGDDFIVGSVGLDSLFGGAGRDLLLGNDNNDFLVGGDGNDNMFGGEGNDVVVGENGDDFIQGTDIVNDDGKGQIDILYGFLGFSNGESDRDTFVLGNQIRVFYDDGNSSTMGTDDFAVIKDFTDGQDQIQLNADVSYRLGNVSNLPGSGFSGVGVFVDNNGSSDELIGVVQGANISQLSISDSGDFTFIT